MFSVSGQLVDGRQASISWFPLGLERRREVLANSRGLVGDADLIRCAIEDELNARTFEATVTGPFFRSDLDDPRATIIQLASYFRSGYSVDGEPPPRVVHPVGRDAVA